MSLKQKIINGYLIMNLLLLINTGISTYNLNKTNNGFKDTLSSELSLLLLYEELRYNISDQNALARGYVIFGEADYKERFIQETEDNKKTQDKILNAKHSKEIESIIEKSNQWEEDTQKVFALYDSGQRKQAFQLLENEVTPQSRELRDGLEKIVQQREESIEKKREELLSKGNKVFYITIILAVLSIIFGLMMGRYYARLIVDPIIKVADKLKQLSNKDFSGEALVSQTNNELGIMIGAVNTMVDNTRALLVTAKETSLQVAASSEQLSASAEQSTQASEVVASMSQESAAGAESQLTQTEQSENVIHQMNTGIQKVTDKTMEANSMVSHVKKISEDGGEKVQTILTQMQDIHLSVENLSHTLQLLGKRSNEIGEIVKIITDIADQTNLLSLNAAIEAARAGENGKGFAVVADEVRKLAEQSSTSAGQISQLIQSIQNETNNALSFMEDSTKKVSVGVNLSEEVSETFGDISNQIYQLNSHIELMSQAMKQFLDGSSYMNETFEVIKETAKTNAAAIEETSSATEEQLATMQEISSSAHALSVQADELQETLKQFKL